MNSQYSEYAKYFKAGQRVRVTIPFGEGKVFNEWGLLSSLAEDLAELQLSRDVLPAGARLGIGITLEMRTGSSGSGYRCRSIVVEVGAEKKLLVRLIGEVILDELREYFRIDVYLPMLLSFPESADAAIIKEEWQARRARAGLAQKTDESRLKEEIFPDAGQVSPWTDVPTPKAANISGGGVKVTIPEKLREESLVNLTVFLPLHPPALLEMVGQVITAAPVQTGSGTHYATAFRFFYIDERDRDRIIQYITAEQLSLLRQYRKTAEDSGVAPPMFRRGRKALLAIVAVSIISLVIIWLVSWFSSYHRLQPKSEVHRIFEKGLREYLEKFRQ